MTLFWIISAAMILVALVVLARTLLRQHAASEDATEQLNVNIAREHLAELVKQKDAGELSDEEFAQARQDLELALAQDLAGTTGQAAAGKGGVSGGRWALPVVGLLVPLITIPLYFEIGSPQLIEGLPGQTRAAQGHGGSGDLPPIGELVDQLRARMDANPDNAEGWFLLGRTYMRLQRYPDAVYAFQQVVRLLPEESAALMSLADAMAMRDGGKVGAEAVALLERALKIDPDSVTALWLLGNAAADNGDNAQALEYWQRAYPMLDTEPSMQVELGRMITTAGGELPRTAASLPPIMPPPASTAAAATAVETDAAGSGAAIDVEVALAPALFAQADANDTVFILARAENGPPMPLAVSRHRVADLPLSITLTDAMAMMPAMKLSAFPRVKVSARVSKSGQAGSQPGDLSAADVVVDSMSPPDSVQLLIDRVVE